MRNYAALVGLAAGFGHKLESGRAVYHQPRAVLGQGDAVLWSVRIINVNFRVVYAAITAKMGVVRRSYRRADSGELSPRAVPATAEKKSRRWLIRGSTGTGSDWAQARPPGWRPYAHSAYPQERELQFASLNNSAYAEKGFAARFNGLSAPRGN